MIYRKSDVPADLQQFFVKAEIGLESSPAEYIAKLVDVFREVRRVLRKDGVAWVNLGDSYSSGNSGQTIRDSSGGVGGPNVRNTHDQPSSKAPLARKPLGGVAPKNLLGMPWRLAFALQADGWWLRQDIIWAKPNPMPESVTDRCTKAHEYIFLLSKSERYFYDAAAISEQVTDSTIERLAQNVEDQQGSFRAHAGIRGPDRPMKAMAGKSAHMEDTPRNDAERQRAKPGTYTAVAYDAAHSEARGPNNNFGAPDRRNKRSVWTITTEPYPEAHFATFPTELPRICILAGTRIGDTVLDPFAGSGTTLQVALELSRQAIGIELNAAYVALANRRLNSTTLGLPLEIAA